MAAAVPQGGTAASAPLVAPVTGGLVHGPAIASVGADPADAATSDLPDHASDGTTVLRAHYPTGTDDRGLPVFTSSILVGTNVLGAGDLLSATPLADQPADGSGWSDLGNPAVSDDGEVVAFAGDPGDGTGPGLFLSWRGDQGGWLPPTRLLDGSQMSAFDTGARLDLVHRAAGAAGPVDDTVTVAFLGTPAGATATGSDQPGLFTERVTFRDPGAGGVVVEPTDPVPVVQLGDRVLGSDPVDALSIHDPVAAAGSSASDHQLTWWQRAGGVERVMRATWVGDGSSVASAAGLATPTARPDLQTGAGPMPVSHLPDRPAAGSRAVPAATSQAVATPAFPAVVATVLDGDANTAVGLTNASRLADGTPTPVVLDPGDGSGSRTVGPGASLHASYGPGTATVTATATAGGDSLSARLPLSVASVTDHPPVADVGGPYRADVGAGLTLDASGSADPDSADTLSFTWDLDGDGTYGDATGPTVELSPRTSSPPSSAGAPAPPAPPTTWRFGSTTVAARRPPRRPRSRSAAPATSPSRSHRPASRSTPGDARRSPCASRRSTASTTRSRCPPRGSPPAGTPGSTARRSSPGTRRPSS